MTPHGTSLAVIAGGPNPNDTNFSIGRAEFHGTAFCIAPNLFLTAAHVYDDAAATGQVALGRLGGQVQIQLVRDAEVFRDVDLALLLCPGLVADILPFNFNALAWLNDIFSFGFAFGLEPAELPGENHIYQLRAFKGYVVNRRGLTQLAGVPPAYELSFAPPPGLSGAPLLFAVGETIAVTGIILKHHTAELAGRKMDLGLAVDSEELLTLNSRLVGGSIAERLFRREMLPPRQRQT